MLHFLLFLNRSLYWFYVYISFVFFVVCQIHQMFICNIYLTSWLLQVVVDAESRASCTPQKIKHSTRLLKRWVIFNIMFTTNMYKILKDFIIWGFFISHLYTQLETNTCAWYWLVIFLFMLTYTGLSSICMPWWLKKKIGQILRSVGVLYKKLFLTNLKHFALCEIE